MKHTHTRLFIVNAVVWLWILAITSVGCSLNNVISQELQISNNIQDAVYLMDDFYSHKDVRSASYTSKPLSSSELNEAVAYIQAHEDVSCYVLLMMLREQSPDKYNMISKQTKARILLPFLSDLASYHELGVLYPPGSLKKSFDGPAGQAIIELGKDAVPLLRTELHNRKRVDTEGNADNQTETYPQRIKDFAYRYIQIIIGDEPVFIDDPYERYQKIDEFQQKVQQELLLSKNVRKAVVEIDDVLERQSHLLSFIFIENILSDDELSEAMAYIKNHEDISSYILLMILRKQSPAKYNMISKQTKARILCSALSKLITLEEFGFLNSGKIRDRSAAKALVELGRDALPYLRLFLYDNNRVYMEGSPNTTASVYQYRKKDYAYLYAQLILGEEPVFLEDPGERDKLIDKLQDRLNRELSYPVSQ